MGSEPVLASLLWPDERQGPWEITVWWRAQHGVAVPVGFEIKSWDDRVREGDEGVAALPEPDADVELPTIGSQFMKSLPIGQILDRSRETILDFLHGEGLPLGWSEETREFVEAWRSEARSSIGPALATGSTSGRDLGDAHYQEVAEIYRAAVRTNRPPTMAVADHFTVSKSAAAKKVARARDRGFLPPTTRGRVGRLTEEL